MVYRETLFGTVLGVYVMSSCIVKYEHVGFPPKNLLAKKSNKIIYLLIKVGLNSVIYIYILTYKKQILLQNKFIVKKVFFLSMIITTFLILKTDFFTYVQTQILAHVHACLHRYTQRLKEKNMLLQINKIFSKDFLTHNNVCLYIYLYICVWMYI